VHHGRVATKESDRSLPDLLTVTAIALVAYAASNVWHEAVGHGGACVALGGKPNVLSSVHFDCGEEAISALVRRGVAAAGTIVNFIAGAIGLVALKASNPVRKPHISYFLWLFTTLNLLMGAGYFLFSGVGNIGDWADVASDTVSPFIWRPAMAVLGGALYFLLARRSGQWLGALVGSDALSMRRSRLLSVTRGVIAPKGEPFRRITSRDSATKALTSSMRKSFAADATSALSARARRAVSDSAIATSRFNVSAQ